MSVKVAISLLLVLGVLGYVYYYNYQFLFNEQPAVEEVVEEVVEEAPAPRQWSVYMQEWLQTNRLVIDYLNVKEKEWCAVAIQRIDPEHPGADPVLDCIN